MKCLYGCALFFMRQTTAHLCNNCLVSGCCEHSRVDLCDQCCAACCCAASTLTCYVLRSRCFDFMRSSAKECLVLYSCCNARFCATTSRVKFLSGPRQLGFPRA